MKASQAARLAIRSLIVFAVPCAFFASIGAIGIAQLVGWLPM